MTPFESLEVRSPHVAAYGGKPTTTSQDVATYFGKEHRHVLRAIRDLIREIGAQAVGLPNFGQSPDPDAPDFGQSPPNPDEGLLKTEQPSEPAALNFALIEYENEQGKRHPAYRMTRDGFTLLAMGFTGKEALKFKLAYIEAFNRMEERLRLERVSAGPAERLTTGLENGRYLVAFEGQGKFSLQEVPMFSSVLDPHNLMQMRTLIQSLVPTEVLVPMLQAGIDRLSHTRKGLK